MGFTSSVMAVARADRSTRVTFAVLSLNLLVSVAIVWANKLAYQTGFRWALLLTILHFATTFLGLELSATFGLFERRKVPIREVLSARSASKFP